MTWKILIAHAEGEEKYAEALAKPLRRAGYQVAHRGTVMVGESVVEEASKVLNAGGPVILCGTVKAVGTRWAHQLVNAARSQESRFRVFLVQIEKEAYVDIFSSDGNVARYWQDPNNAVKDLLASLEKYYPLNPAPDYVPFADDAEQRYRELALESCDIIDLANLPEKDRHEATRKLELRRLYVSLRVQVEIAYGTKLEEAAFEGIEKRRAATKLSAAYWGQANKDETSEHLERVSVGYRLAKSRKLVVLGDPGAGKTTMLRWIATAYLLRFKQDPDWKDLPDIESLPNEDWLPIIIRCRDLNKSALRGALDDVLHFTLRKAELTEPMEMSLRKVLRERLSKGNALLLLDGLDEITDPGLRARFCQQIEKISAAYPDAPIIVTSRIVGYREMGYRIKRGFEHVTVADLSGKDKDEFARRWCALTELAERREAATEDLIRDIHSTDRIERLTGNPMLLTTMALIKRSIGRLPSRRADLYWNALEVLLNWRREVDEPIDDSEAVTQLEYVAYAMCDRGVQQLRKDEIIGLFKRMRKEYPQIHPVRKHLPEKFLHLLESRTGLLVETGRVRHLGKEVAVFEFRHLTFQEYLAARALVDGCFPDRDRSRSLAQHVATLAGKTGEVHDSRFGTKETGVIENWREALRLCSTICLNDDVEEILLAILNPLRGEDAAITTRPRAVMAASCLADEPNVGDEVAKTILRKLAEQIMGSHKETSGSLNTAIMDLAKSRWAELLRSALIQEFWKRKPIERGAVGEYCGDVAEVSWPHDKDALAK